MCLCKNFPHVFHLPFGWLDHRAVGKDHKTCETPKKRKHRITTIGVTMATLTGLVMAIIYHTFICTANPHRFIPDGATFSSRAFVVYLVLLIMFPPAGWSLGVARGNIPQDDRSLVPKMSLEAVATASRFCGHMVLAHRNSQCPFVLRSMTWHERVHAT